MVREQQKADGRLGAIIMGDNELIDKIDKARFWVMTVQPFYGALAMRLSDRICDFPTAYTNGTVIGWGREFLTSLTDQETRFVLLHEIMHVAHGHLWNMPICPKANVAQDYVINLILSKLQKSGVDITMPKMGLLDEKYEGMSEEEVFSLLPETQSYVDNCGGIGGIGLTKEELEKLEGVWEQTLTQANIAAQIAGQETPDVIARQIAQQQVRKIDWRAEMSEFLLSSQQIKSDWSRSSRRHALAPCIVPRKKVISTGNIVVVRDTSGSVGADELGLFNSALDAIVSEMCVGVTLLDADTEIRSVYELSPGDFIPDTAKGGGGTSFIDAIQYAEALDGVSGVVYLTDMEGTFPKTCKIPVLWVSSSNIDTAPYGRVVRM